MKVKPKPVTDDEIIAAFAGTNFGDTHPKQVLATGVLTIASGMACGGTLTSIMRKMKLLKVAGTLTCRGKMFMWEMYHAKAIAEAIGTIIPPEEAARRAAATAASRAAIIDKGLSDLCNPGGPAVGAVVS